MQRCVKCQAYHQGDCPQEDWRPLLEPGAVSPLLHKGEQVALSQAISLKRIADALTAAGFADDIKRAIHAGISEGANEAIYWWKQGR
jgi:hypothetical protein